MKIHKIKQRLVRSLILVVTVVGAITLFTNLSFTGGQTVASAATGWRYDPETKTLTIGMGELATDFKDNIEIDDVEVDVSEVENIVFGIQETTTKKVIAPADSHALFADFVNLKQFLGIQNFNTANATNMAGMFRNCAKLTTLDLSWFNTANVESMEDMFLGCSGLTTLNFSSFNTPNLAYMESMFNGCSGLTTLDLSSFDTSKSEYMSFMFAGCTNLTTLDLSSFDTTAVRQMDYMFTRCGKLTTLDLSHFSTPNLTYMDYMFNGCSSLTTLDMSLFDTSAVEEFDDAMYHMFNGMTALWRITLGPAFMISDNTGLPNPVFGTKFNQDFVVISNNWVQTTTETAYTAAQIPAAHIAGHTDTYVWQSDKPVTVEYVVEPTYTITIPATITIPSATVAGTGNVTLSAYPKVPYLERFIHISATSGITNPWHLTTTGDATGAEYDFTAEGGVNLKTGSAIVLEANGEAPAPTVKTISASLTDNTHKFKYAGTYMDTVTFTIETAAS